MKSIIKGFKLQIYLMTLNILKVLNKPKYVINQSKQSSKLRSKNH